MTNQIINQVSKYTTLLFFIFCFLLSNNFLFADNSISKKKMIKIACVGDSITYGEGVHKREQNSYPMQLQRLLNQHLLEQKYIVKNFGVSGATALELSQKPYTKTSAYEESKSFLPDIVFIKLGTNDAYDSYKSQFSSFYSNYLKLVESYKKLPSKPLVIIVLPVAAFDQPRGSRIFNLVLPTLRKIAYESNTEILDLHSQFQDKIKLFPDKLHPNIFGAEKIALSLYDYLHRKRIDYNITKKIALFFPIVKKNFYGYQKIIFSYQGVKCVIIKPFRAAYQLPWVWKSSFVTNNHKIDLSLLEKGYHIVSINVPSFFGIPNTLKIWNFVYQSLRTIGLAKKVTLEITDKGVIATNWAKKNSHKVLATITTLGKNQNKKEILDSILKADNRYFNTATLGRASVEYRARSAGWSSRDWQGELRKLNRMSCKGGIDLMFLGDSITQSWTGSARRKAVKNGNRIFDKVFSKYNAASYGISGDKTEHLLYRINNGNLSDKINPKVIVLMIGVNNLLQGDTGQQIAQGTVKIVSTIRNIKPKCKIILLGCFPTGYLPDSKARKEVNIIHKKIQFLIDNQNVFYYDMRPFFLDKEGKLNYQFMSKDNVHLNQNGYKLWAEKLLPMIENLMERD